MPESNDASIGSSDGELTKRKNGVRGRISLTAGDEPLSSVIVSAHDFDPYRLLVGQENSPFSGPQWSRLRASFEPNGTLYEPASGLAETFLGQLFGSAKIETPLRNLGDLLVELPDSFTGADREADVVDPLEAFLDPLWMLGQRLGSVQPDIDGRFELTYNPSAYRRGDPTGRPDLLIAVFAPALAQPRNVVEGQLATALPLTGSPFERLLALTFAGRANVGLNESYLIRIDRALAIQLGAAPPHVTIQEPSQQLSPEDRVKSQLDAKRRQIELDDLYKAGVRDLRAPQIDKAYARRKKTRDKINRLSSLPEAMRSNPLVLPDIGTKAEKTERTRAAKEALAADAATRLPIREVSTRMAFELPHLSAMLPTIDLTGASFNIQWDVLCRLIHEAGGGHGLVRTRSVAQALEGLERFTREPASGAREEAAGEEDPPIESPPEGTIEERIQKRVEGLIADMTMGDIRSTDVKATAANTLKADLETATLYKGPADTTAYHDFHTLQIAYGDIWEEVMSGAARGLVSEVLENVNQLTQSESVVDDAVNNILSMEKNDLLFWTEGIEEDISVEEATAELISVAASLLWPEAVSIWSRLPTFARNALETIASRPITVIDPRITPPEYTATDHLPVEQIYQLLPAGGDLPPGADGPAGFVSNGTVSIKQPRQILDVINARRIEGIRFLSSAEDRDRDEIVSDTDSRLPSSRLMLLLDELKALLGENYSFAHFAKDSYNFGIITTYRQTWEPGDYQVGELVKTVPLAPGETRKYTTKESIKRERSTKELEKALSTLSGESTTKTSTTQEIIEKVEKQTKFQHGAQGGFNIGIGNFQSTANFAMDQSAQSQDVKKQLREAVTKASHEYKNERSFEVNTNTEFQSSRETSGELRNPNNELTVTYLLYELQRQYRISEKLHALTPVILIAFDMPEPDAITESWLLKYEWILRRVLLDDSFVPALNSLTDGFVSEEVSLGILKTNWKTQKDVVAQLQMSHEEFTNARRALERRLINARRQERVTRAVEDSTGLLFDLAEAVGGVDVGGIAVEEAAAAVEAIEQQLSNVQRETEALSSQLNAAQNALGDATHELTEALKARSQQRVNIDQLRVHVKQNILYYMQAIMSHKTAGQLYMELHMKEVIVPRAGTATARARIVDETVDPWLPGRRHGRLMIDSIDPPVWRPDEDGDKFYLHEVAEIDRPMGYKGNYIIFPLKGCSLVTDYMMIEYVDSYFGVRDPDAFSDYTTEELIRYREAARPEGVQLESLNAIIAKRLQENVRDDDLIVVPSGQLYMEALVGSHTLLEPFKLAHRAYDALAAKEEVRKRALENARYAARLTKTDPDYSDPDVDKLVEKRTS